MFCLKTQSRMVLRNLAGVALCAMVGIAQTVGSTGQPPPTPPVITVPPPPGAQQQFATNFTSVTPQYNFAYGQNPSQPLLPTGGFWNYYMPGPLGPSTPGWTTNGLYGTEGVPSAYYNEPNYSGTSVGGCAWNVDYDSPPFWFYDTGGSDYQKLSGPELVGSAGGGGAIGSTYQTLYEQVPGSGVPVYGFGAMATWDPHVYPSTPVFIGEINFNTNPCNGATEVGFAHYFNDSPPANQFYFYQNSNCQQGAPKDQEGNFGCYNGAMQVAEQCQGAVNLPTLTGNSKGNYWYFWYIYVSYNSTTDHYLLNAGLQDPYTEATAWSCTYDATANTFSSCPSLGEPVPYGCAAGPPYQPFAANLLYPGHGAVDVGVNNNDNKPLNGGVNPMMQMTALYILETAP